MVNPFMKKFTQLPVYLNYLLILMLVVLGVNFVFLLSFYSLALALVAFSLAIGLYRRNRWAYFGSAVWALACYQLAREGLALEELKRALMVLSIPLVVLSIYLHEKLGRKKRT